MPVQPIQQSTSNYRVLFELEDVISDPANYGVDAVDAAIVANNDLVYQDSVFNVELNPENADIPIARPCASFSGTDSQRLATGLGATIDFYLTDAINPGNAAGEAPRNRNLLQVSRLVETIVAATSATYKPTSDGGHQSASMHIFHRNTNDNLWRMSYLLGFRGALSMDLPENNLVTCQLAGKGITYPNESDVAVPSNANYRLWSQPLAFFNAAGEPALDKNGDAVTYTGTVSKDLSNVMMTGAMKLTADGIDFPIRSATFAQNYDVVVQPGSSPTAVSRGVDLLRANDAASNGTFQLAETGAAFRRAAELLYGAGSVAASIELLSATTKYTITMPKLRIVAQDPSDNNGWREWGVGFALSGDFSGSTVGDNEYEIVVTQRV